MGVSKRIAFKNACSVPQSTSLKNIASSTVSLSLLFQKQHKRQLEKSRFIIV